MNTAYLQAILASIFWGAGFIGSRYALESFDAMWVTFFRFLIGTICLSPILFKVKKSDFSKELFKGSILCGSLLTFMMFFQIKGVEYTTIAKSGFITITYAFITPIISFLFFKESITKYFICCATLSFIGIALMCDMDLTTLNYGDYITFLSAIFTSFQLIFLSNYLRDIKAPMLFNFIQMLSVTLIAFLVAIIFEGVKPLRDLSLYTNSNAIYGLVFMGIFSTAIGFVLQAKCQRYLKGHIAGIIYLIESPFAAVLGFLFFAETLSIMGIMGSFVVIVSIVFLLLENKIKKKVINH